EDCQHGILGLANHTWEGSRDTWGCEGVIVYGWGCRIRRSILTDSQVTPTKHGRMKKPYSSHRFIANYFSAGHLKMEVKAKKNSEEIKDIIMVTVRLKLLTFKFKNTSKVHIEACLLCFSGSSSCRLRDDDKLYKFKEGDFKRRRIQDTEDMLLLLVQEKLTNLTVEERFAFNVSLRMFTRSIVIQRRVKDLQLVLTAGVDQITITWAYNANLTATAPDTNYTTVEAKLCYAPVSQTGQDDRKTVDNLDRDKTCPFVITDGPYQLSDNSFVWTIPNDIPNATYFVRVYALDADDDQIGYGQSTNGLKTSNLFHIDGTDNGDDVSKESDALEMVNEFSTILESLSRPMENVSVVDNEIKEPIIINVNNKDSDKNEKAQNENNNNKKKKKSCVDKLMDNKHNDEPEIVNKIKSFANTVSENVADNKLKLIPTVFDEGRESEPKTLPLWVKLFNVTIEAWTVNGISVIASRLGKPRIKDKTTRMCSEGTGRVGYARVLVEVQAEKEFKNMIEICYKSGLMLRKCSKFVEVEYTWKPPICSHYRVFGHVDNKCGKKNRDENIDRGEESQECNGNEQNKDGFVETRQTSKNAMPKENELNEVNEGLKNDSNTNQGEPDKSAWKLLKLKAM
nr:high-affinity nitrate transporter [Tanacetum cinerariifolium]